MRRQKLFGNAMYMTAVKDTHANVSNMAPIDMNKSTQMGPSLDKHWHELQEEI